MDAAYIRVEAGVTILKRGDAPRLAGGEVQSISVNTAAGRPGGTAWLSRVTASNHSPRPRRHPCARKHT